MYLVLCIYLCKPYDIVLVDYEDSNMNARAKELEFPVHFYSVSFYTSWHQKCNSIEELQQCSLIEVSKKKKYGSTHWKCICFNWFRRTKIPFGLYFWGYASLKMLPGSKKVICLWFANNMGSLSRRWQTKILDNDACSHSSNTSFCSKSHTFSMSGKPGSDEAAFFQVFLTP